MAGSSANARYSHSQYNRGNATYGDLAYNLDSMSREHALRHAGKPVRQEVVPAPQVRTVARARRRERQKVSIVTLLGFSAVTVLVMMVLLQYVRLTEISESVVNMKAELAQLETENISLTTKYEQTFELATVKQVAEQSGMTKPSSSQVYYIDLSDSDCAVVYQTEDASVLSRVLTSLDQRVDTVVEYFD